MDVTKKIKQVMLDNDMGQEDLAILMKTTQSNISKKFKANNYRIKELEEIAEALGCNLEVNFVKK